MIGSFRPVLALTAVLTAVFVLTEWRIGALGALLGLLLPSARAAQGIGLVLFFGTFFLVGGGPPPGVLPDAVNTVARYTPTGLLVDSIRSPWIGEGIDLTALVSLTAIAIISSAPYLLGLIRLEDL